MSAAGLIAGIVIGVFAVILLAATAPPKQITTYQKCIMLAEHEREDRQAAFKQMCSVLPDEPGDRK